MYPSLPAVFVQLSASNDLIYCNNTITLLSDKNTITLLSDKNTITLYLHYISSLRILYTLDIEIV